MYILIDGPSLGYRVWFAKPTYGYADVPDSLEEIKGVARSFMSGYCTELTNIVKTVDLMRPAFSKVFICWEGYHSIKQRRAIYPEYKQSRVKHRDKRDHINPQGFMHIVRNVLSDVSPAFGLNAIYAEADDLIAIISNHLKGESKCIVTRDRDMFQLVDDVTTLYDHQKRSFYDSDDVFNEVGVYPTQIAAFKALAGDPSDNYPGQRGIGPKKAVALLRDKVKILNLELDNKSHGIFYKLAKLPFADFDTSKFDDAFSLLPKNEQLDWDSISQSWGFSQKLAADLRMVV